MFVLIVAGESVCNDVRNNKHFKLLNKYGDVMITSDPGRHLNQFGKNVLNIKH